MCKITINGDSETQIPENCLKSGKSEIVYFLEFQKPAKAAFGMAAHTTIEQFIYARTPPHLKKSINQAHLENGTYEQIVTHLERELDFNRLEAPEEQQINTVIHNTANTNADRPKSTCHHCKEPRHYRNQCHLLKRQKEQSEATQNVPGNKNSGACNSIPNSTTNKNRNNDNHKNSNRAESEPKTVYPTCETCGKTIHSTEKCYYGANAANRPPPGTVQERANQNDSNEITEAAAQHLNKKCHVFTPELRQTDRRLLNFHQSLKLSGSNIRRLI